MNMNSNFTRVHIMECLLTELLVNSRIQLRGCSPLSDKKLSNLCVELAEGWAALINDAQSIVDDSLESN